jgi:hypothetical protein
MLAQIFDCVEDDLPDSLAVLFRPNESALEAHDVLGVRSSAWNALAKADSFDVI